jgi:carbonic anhydrase/acetyltransferase-like protein (isoleucine patch superfamily)
MNNFYAFQGKRPRIGKNVFVAPSAIVIGDVEIGDDSSIWYGTVLRGDVMPIRIGKRTNIQDNCLVHVTSGVAGTYVGDEVTVGHSVVLHATTVRDRCLVGMGSVLLDGSFVDTEAMVAAGSLVTPNTRVPSHVLAMGRPARVVRPLTDAEKEHLIASAQGYVDVGAAFLSGDCVPCEPETIG